MRIYINLFFLGLLFFTSCKSDNTPDGIIPQDKMIDLMTEVHIVDGSMYTYAQTPDTLQKYGMARYLLLFKKYNTDTLQFKKSLEYYTFKSDVISKMYDQVMLKLQAKTDSLNKIGRVKAKQDSIRIVGINKIRADSIARANKLNGANKSADKERLRNK